MLKKCLRDDRDISVGRGRFFERLAAIVAKSRVRLLGRETSCADLGAVILHNALPPAFERVADENFYVMWATRIEQNRKRTDRSSICCETGCLEFSLDGTR